MSSQFAAQLLTAALVLFAGANALAHGLFLFAGFDHQRGFRPLFDLSREWNAPSLYSGGLIFACGAALGRAGLRLRQRGDALWASWCFLAAVFVYLSIDEVFGLHEHLTGATRELLHITNGPFYFAWVIPGLAFAFVVFLLSLSFLRELDRRSRFYVMLAGAVYVTGAVGFEILGGWRWRILDGDITDPLYIVLFSIEEMLEIAGMSLMLYAVLRRSELMFGADAAKAICSPGLAAQR
ncbi:MAG TPA: hypothetical protein PLS69_10505 [Terricaulis sp.]|nr:hypothetical protein [Terricaulis sp.]HRP10327.1 hypothetical protein [Terricaulis sp.]